MSTPVAIAVKRLVPQPRSILPSRAFPSLPGNPERHWDAFTSALLTVSLIALLCGIKGMLKADVHCTEVGIALVVASPLAGLFLPVAIFGWNKWPPSVTVKH